MTFEEILDQAVAMLQRLGQVTYRTLKRQFNLDDEALEDLKDQLLFSHPVIDQNGRGLVWTGDAEAPSKSDTRRDADAEARFHAILPALTAVLQREGRITYSSLKRIFGLDEVLLDSLRRELILRRLAVDEDGLVLAWAGEAQPAVQPPISTTPPAFTPADTTVPAPPTDASSGPEPIRIAPDAERRQLTVMFCDLADSTRLSQQLDPEDLREVVQAYQATAAGVIAQYDGHIAQYLGDGLLIYFGWPAAHEDDAQRAAHAGLGIVEAITTALNARLQQDKGVQLTVRIGIHTGPVVVGEMGSGERHENLATGETVNIAARLEGLARPNTVVISHVTERLLWGAFALEEMGAHELKGIAAPIAVFRVLGAIDDYRDTDNNMPDGDVYLVGRDEEVGLLLRRWEQSKEGLGQVVLISGEAGIGKSSLVEMLYRHVRAEDLPRIAFRCSPYHQNSALYPVITHIEHLLQFEREDSPALKLNKLEQVLQRYSFPLEEVMSLFAALLSLPVPEECSPALQLTPQQQKQQTLDALVGWLLEEAERQPVLVVWEDLHWADASTLEMLAMVLEQSPTVAMLSALTYRPAFEPPWPMRSHMTPITLNRLERMQVEALIMHLAHGKALPDEVIEHIVGKTDGVPLFVEELTKMLMESDLLHAEERHYELTGSLSTVTIPATLQDSLMARLDRLPTGREVAQLGSVIGREFSHELLWAVTDMDAATLQAGLAQLVEAEILYRRGRPPKATYIFKHALIQDAAYASLLRNTRQKMHQRIIQVLETRFPDTVATQPELLAHHCTEANLLKQAADYWHVAGRDANERFAYPEAIAHLNAALEALAHLPGTSERAQRELDVHLTLGPAQMTLHGFGSAEVEMTYTRAYELCQQLHLQESRQFLQVLYGLRRIHSHRGNHQKSQEISEQSLRLAQRLDDLPMLLDAQYSSGVSLMESGDIVLARKHFERGMVLGERLADQALTSVYGGTGRDRGLFCHSMVARALWLLGHPEQARQRVQDALAMARKRPHPFTLAFVLIQAGFIAMWRREVEATREYAQAAVNISAENDYRQWLAWATMLCGWATLAQGQRYDGITQMRQGLDATLATGSVNRDIFLNLLAESYATEGQAEEGLSILTETMIENTMKNGRVQASTMQVSPSSYTAEVYRVQGKLLLLQSTPDEPEAEICFHKSLDFARQQQAKSWELRAATCLARLWQSQGKRQEAYELLRPVYGWFSEGFDTADLQEAKMLLEELG